MSRSRSTGVRRERTCWICRASDATTGEHKWPAAYLRRIPDDWSNLHHGTWEGGRALHTQGPQSKNLTLRVLCQECNNARTAPQDEALDALLKAIESNEEEVWLTRSVLLDHAPESHHVLDLYRSLLKLEFSRLYDGGVPVADPIADFVAGGSDWEAANGTVRIEFRAVENLRPLSLIYPSETDAISYLNPFFISHQINFGWLGIHFVYAPAERPEFRWPPWSLARVGLVPCGMYGRTAELPQ